MVLCGVCIFRQTVFAAVRYSRFSLPSVHLPSSRSMSTYPIDDDFFGLSSHEKQLRNTVFQFCQNELAPIAERIDQENDFPEIRDFWRKIGELGFLGVTAPAEYGGLAGSYMDQNLIFEEFSRVSPAIGLSVGAHSNLCVNQITRHATDEQKERFLPKLMTGEVIGALAMSEANAGSDVVSMTTRADKKGDYYVLNGSKFWITNGPDADVVVVYAKTEPDAKQHGITTFIVERGMEGFSAGPKLDKMGMRGSNTSELIFNNVKVPVSNVLGKVNRGVYVLMSGLDIERVLIGAGAVGTMQGCVDVAFDYAHTRETFGNKIGTYQMIQSKLADMYTKLNSCRTYTYTVTRALDAGQTKPMDCSAVALLCAESATQVALDAIQIMGGNGYINDNPVSRLMRDAKLFEIGGGTSEVRRLIIARALNHHYR